MIAFARLSHAHMFNPSSFWLNLDIGDISVLIGFELPHHINVTSVLHQDSGGDKQRARTSAWRFLLLMYLVEGTRLEVRVAYLRYLVREKSHLATSIIVWAWSNGPWNGYLSYHAFDLFLVSLLHSLVHAWRKWCQLHMPAPPVETPRLFNRHHTQTCIQTVGVRSCSALAAMCDLEESATQNQERVNCDFLVVSLSRISHHRRPFLALHQSLICFTYFLKSRPWPIY